ncbi:ATP-binding cassette domain-containing protein, partial [Vibrio cholerae]
MYAVTPQWNTPALKEELEPTEIEFRNVGKCFPAKGKTEAPFAIRDVNFKIRRGEVVSIIGPSGCGKSTILNMGSGLYRPTE